MANTQTATDIRDNSTQISIRRVDTDSPIFPIETLERLHNFRPDLVDEVIEMTTAESSFRRSETVRINTLEFSQRLVGQIAAFLLGLSSVSGGIWLVYLGKDWAGVSIAGMGLTGLAVAFIKSTSKPSEE